jgi:hypothetical protein
MILIVRVTLAPMLSLALVGMHAVTLDPWACYACPCGAPLPEPSCSHETSSRALRALACCFPLASGHCIGAVLLLVTAVRASRHELVAGSLSLRQAAAPLLQSRRCCSVFTPPVLSRLSTDHPCHWWVGAPLPTAVVSFLQMELQLHPTGQLHAAMDSFASLR